MNRQELTALLEGCTELIEQRERLLRASGGPYLQELTATAGTPPYTWTLAGTLPLGTTFGGNTLSAMPTTPGVYTLQASVLDASGTQVSRAYALAINPAGLSITTTSPLLTHPPCAYQAAIEQAFMARGLPLTASIEIGSLEVIKQAVQVGLGIAILPQLAARHIPPGTVVRAVDDWSLHLPFGIITREVPLPQNKVAQTFRTFLKQAIAQSILQVPANAE